MGSWAVSHVSLCPLIPVPPFCLVPHVLAHARLGSLESRELVQCLSIPVPDDAQDMGVFESTSCIKPEWADSLPSKYTGQRSGGGEEGVLGKERGQVH